MAKMAVMMACVAPAVTVISSAALYVGATSRRYETSVASTPPRRQAERARSAFPDADFHLFRNSGHFPLWDTPAATAELILSVTER